MTIRKSPLIRCLAALLVAMAAMFALAACGSDDGGDGGNTPQQQAADGGSSGEGGSDGESGGDSGADAPNTDFEEGGSSDGDSGGSDDGDDSGQSSEKPEKFGVSGRPDPGTPEAEVYDATLDGLETLAPASEARRDKQTHICTEECRDEIAKADTDSLCDLLSTKGREYALLYANRTSGKKEQIKDCGEALRSLMRIDVQLHGRLKIPKVIGVLIDPTGQVANAALSYGKDEPLVQAQMIKEDGEWKLWMPPIDYRNDEFDEPQPGGG